MPEPEIPADDAWSQMNDMLYPNSAGVSQSVAGKLTKYISQFKWPLLTAVGGVSLSLFVILSPDSKIATNTNQKEKQTSDTLKATEVSPGTETVDFANSESKPINANIPQEHEPKEKFDIDEKADIHNESVPKNQEEPAVRDNKQVNASQSHEKRISNVNKKPDMKAQSNHTAIRHSIENGRSLARNSLRSGQTNGSNNDGRDNNSISSGEDNGRESNSGPSNGTSRNNPALTALAKVYNEPGSLNASADISPAGKNLMHSLAPLPFYYKPFYPNLNKKVKAPKTTAPAQTIKNTSTRGLPVHFGLEWNLNSSLESTDYLLTGTDSVRRPARLLIPGILISKKWASHTLTFSFLPYQPYFSNNKRVQQLPDTTGGNDSLKIYTNANLIKASGMNFTLQYQYQVFGPLLLNAGLSYSTFYSVLIRKETENRFGNILQGPLVTVKKPGDLRSYINPGFFALKAGLAVRPAVWQGRIQAGMNVIVPISNVSKSAENPVRALNGQIYLRIMVR